MVLRGKREPICKYILSSVVLSIWRLIKYIPARSYCNTRYLVPAQINVASNSSTSYAVDVNSFNESRLQTMFQGNYNSGGVFNINLAPAKNTVENPEHPKREPRRIIESKHSSQEIINSILISCMNRYLY